VATVPVRIGRRPAVGGVVAWWPLHGPQRDVLAFDLADPSRAGLELGASDWLGAADEEFAQIWRTPVDWLRAHCSGLVLLGRDDLTKQRVLRHFRSVGAVDAEHGHELRRLVGIPLPGPEVLVPRRAA
jgi:hypothetical protein